MKILKSVFVTIILANSYLALAQTVQLDPNFGNNGIVVTPNTTEIVKTIFTTDSKILSLGYYYKNNSSLTYDWALTKYNFDGTLDNSFGTNGVVFNTDTVNGFPVTMVIQPDNKILVVGDKYYDHIEIAPDVWAGVYKSFIARYESNGIPDFTFGDNGLVVMDFNSISSGFSSLAVLANNQIVVGGSVGSTTILLKLNSDGSVDYSFGNSGLVAFEDPNFMFLISDFQLLKDENILCYGAEFLGYDPTFWEPYGRIAVLKLDTNGEFVSSFGNNGIVFIENEYEYGMPYCSKSVEIKNHQIILGGDRILLKLNSDGSLDNTFGNQGIARHSYPFVDMDVEENGRIYIAGSKVINIYDYGYSVCRFNANGIFDGTFNNMGYFDINPSNNNDYVQCVTFQSDGKLLLSGSVRTNGSANFAIARLIVDDVETSITSINFADVKIFPNPVRNELHIESGEHKINRVEIVDLSGKAIYRFNNSRNQINVSALPQGVYFVKIETERGAVTRKLIKE